MKRRILIIVAVIFVLIAIGNSKRGDTASTEEDKQEAVQTLDVIASENPSEISQENGEPQAMDTESEAVEEYHKDKILNQLINDYNSVAVSTELITEDMVNDGAYDFKALVGISGVSVVLTENENGIFVDYTYEGTTDEPVKNVFRNFCKALDSELSDEDIASAWENLQSGNYQYYDYYYFDQDKFECSYMTTDLSNDEVRYTVKTQYTGNIQN